MEFLREKISLQPTRRKKISKSMSNCFGQYQRDLKSNFDLQKPIPKRKKRKIHLCRSPKAKKPMKSTTKRLKLQLKRQFSNKKVQKRPRRRLRSRSLSVNVRRRYGLGFLNKEERNSAGKANKKKVMDYLENTQSALKDMLVISEDKKAIIVYSRHLKFVQEQLEAVKKKRVIFDENYNEKKFKDLPDFKKLNSEVFSLKIKRQQSLKNDGFDDVEKKVTSLLKRRKKSIKKRRHKRSMSAFKREFGTISSSTKEKEPITSNSKNDKNRIFSSLQKLLNHLKNEKEATETNHGDFIVTEQRKHSRTCGMQTNLSFISLEKSVVEVLRMYASKK